MVWLDFDSTKRKEIGKYRTMPEQFLNIISRLIRKYLNWYLA